MDKSNILYLQLFGEGGEGGDGAAAADAGSEGQAGVNVPDAGEARLRELGVPEDKLARRAQRMAKRPAPKQDQPVQQQDASAEEQTPEGNNQPAPSNRMTWDEIMQDPEYNQHMQATVQARLKSAKGAEETLGKLQPAIELMARRYGLDTNELDIDKLVQAVNDDDTNYEDLALKMGVPIETAKRIDQNERENARRQAVERETAEKEFERNWLMGMMRQAEELKQIYPDFDLNREMENDAFARLVHHRIGRLPVKAAYEQIHKEEIEQRKMAQVQQQTATKMANAIRSGRSRPVENGVTGQAPSVTTFDYANASKEQREAFKKRIHEAAARGEKIYPGQR